MVPLQLKQIYFKIEMPESQAKKVFRIQLSVSVVLLLFTLSALSLSASFYLGMIAGKSMQRPPENSTDEAESLAEKPMSDEDLKFFSLGERKKGQDLTLISTRRQRLENQLFRNGSCTTCHIQKIHIGCNFMSTYLGVPRPSAFIL